jgi:tubulin polyglutamylase TTLL1
MASLGRPKFRTEFEKQVIITNLEKRGITRAKEDEDWHFFWASVGTVRQMFNPEHGFRLADHQLRLL